MNGSGYVTIVSNTTATSYLDSGVANWTSYYYVVSAVNGGGEGADSTQISAQPQSPAISTNEQYVSTELSVIGGSATVTFTASVAGHSYQLQFSDSLTDGTWIDCGDAQPGTGASLSFAAPYSNSTPRRFYRIRIRQ